MTRLLGRVGVLLAVMACARTEPLGPLRSWHGGPALDVNEVVRTEATVRFINIEGGCWALQTPRGDYEPFGLPDRYRVNGLHVRVVMRGASVGSFCAIAPIVSIDSVCAL